MSSKVAPKDATESARQEAMKIDPNSVRQEFADSWELGYCLCDIGGPSKPFLALIHEWFVSGRVWCKLAQKNPLSWRKFKQENEKQKILPHLVGYFQLNAFAILFCGLFAGLAYSECTALYDVVLNRIMYLMNGGDPMNGGLTQEEFDELENAYPVLEGVRDDLCRVVGHSLHDCVSRCVTYVTVPAPDGLDCRSCDALKLEKLDLVDCIRDYSDAYAGAAKLNNFGTVFALLFWQYIVHWATWFSIVERQTPCWCCFLCWCDHHTWYIGGCVRFFWTLFVAGNGVEFAIAGFLHASPFFRADANGQRFVPIGYVAAMGIAVAIYCYAALKQVLLSVELTRVRAKEELERNERKKRNILANGERARDKLARMSAAKYQTTEVNRGKRGALVGISKSEAKYAAGADARMPGEETSSTDDEAGDGRPERLESGRFYTVGRSGACNLGNVGGAAVLC